MKKFLAMLMFGVLMVTGCQSTKSSARSGPPTKAEVATIEGLKPVDGVKIYEVEKPQLGPKAEGYDTVKVKQWRAVYADRSFDLITIVHRKGFASSNFFWWVESFPAPLPTTVAEAQEDNSRALDVLEGRAVKRAFGPPQSGQGWGEAMMGAMANIAAAFIIRDGMGAVRVVSNATGGRATATATSN